MPRRPEHFVVPGPGQESIWDYPRPPAVKSDDRLVTVASAGKEIACATRAVRGLETSHLPALYILPWDVLAAGLKPSGHVTFRECRVKAVYLEIQAGGRISPWFLRHFEVHVLIKPPGTKYREQEMKPVGTGHGKRLAA